MTTQAEEAAGMVRQARRGEGWTQTQLAAAARVAPGTVTRIENARPVRPGNLRAVFRALWLPLPEVPQTVDERVRLAEDLVRQWLRAMPDDQVDGALRELTRFTVLR